MSNTFVLEETCSKQSWSFLFTCTGQHAKCLRGNNSKSHWTLTLSTVTSHGTSEPSSSVCHQCKTFEFPHTTPLLAGREHPHLTQIQSVFLVHKQLTTLRVRGHQDHRMLTNAVATSALAVIISALIRQLETPSMFQQDGAPSPNRRCASE